jgi:hypothetical protein
MDDRAQHGYPQATHADGRGAEHGQAPWPSFQAPQAGAPIAGQAPYPGPGAPAQHAPQQQAQPFGQHAPVQAQGMQYQYAPGFVMPGAPTNAQPMSAHGGTIGMPMQPPAHGDTMPMLHGGAQQHHHVFQPAQQAVPPQPAMAMQPGVPMQQHGQHPPMHGAAAVDFASQPQQWAYPTPDGLQLVQPGNAANGAHYSMSAAARRPGGRRMKWETIVPAAAVVCLIAAIGLFISDFDRITGRDASTGSAAATSTKAIARDSDAGAATDTDAGAVAATPADVDATIDEAAKLFEQGNFEDAANLLHPMLDVASPDERVVELHDRIEAAGARNEALLARLGRQRNAGQWSAVIATIGQLEQLRPLSPSLTQLRASARKAITARRAAAAKARAKARAAAPSTSVNGGGSHAGHHAPAAGGHSHANTSAVPPATAPKAPSVPEPPKQNPTTGGGGGIGAAPTGSSCHTHDGVTECH